MTEEALKIRVRSLHKSFANHKVLDGIDLDVKKGSSLVILGGSGTGKSVLIKAIVGLINPDSGNIFIDKVETTNISDSKRFNIMETIGFLFQGGALFDSLTVQDNITFFTKDISKKEKNELAAAKLESVGLSPRILDLYPSELSGGMQKRVALARAICSTPSILFLDEPTTGLDPIMANVINELIIKIQEELGATTVTITHDMISAQKIAKEVAMIYRGKIIWYGTKNDMTDSGNPYVQQFINGSTKGPIDVENV